MAAIVNFISADVRLQAHADSVKTMIKII